MWYTRGPLKQGRGLTTAKKGTLCFPEPFMLGLVRGGGGPLHPLVLMLSYVLLRHHKFFFSFSLFMIKCNFRNSWRGRQKPFPKGNRVHEANWFSQECGPHAWLLGKVKTHHVDHGICSTRRSSTVA